jgi:UDP-N-acetylmuramoyl-tripeptide--D-alanyl-D-alanine ligase
MRAHSGPYRAGDVAKACGGKLLRGDAEVLFAGISTDSRDIKPNDLFVPLRGPNFDGHNFLFPALEAGARGSLLDRDANRDNPLYPTSIVLIQVQDTLHALSDLASAYRTIHPIPLIAVTGSSGKTTVKEMIAAVLTRSHRPLISAGNLNNTIGLPMTVLGIGSEHTVAVVEAGINMIGEMALLAKAASPDVAVITTVGPAHLEGLGSTETVAAEKFQLVQALSERGTAILPSDNPYIEPLVQQCRGRVVRFGTDRGDFRAVDLRHGASTQFRLISPFGERTVRLAVPGRHNVANALAAAAASTAVGVTLDDAVAGLERFTAPSWRMELVALPGGRILVRDCYNANPISMKAALEVLATRGSGRTLAALADMMELGPSAAALHHEVGREAARLRIDRVVFVGSFGPAFAEGFVAGGGDPQALTLAPDKDAAWAAIVHDMSSFAAILVKGSRSMKMETIASRIEEKE